VKSRNRSSDWGILLALTVLWGSAFLFTKFAVDSIPSQLVVVGRLALATVLLVPVAMLFAQRPERGLRYWLFMVLIALFGSALPFSLISWEQQFIDSGLTGILTAVIPIATLSLSHFLVPGERLTPHRITGFAMGFAGVVVIMGPESLVSLFDGAEQIWPMLAPRLILAGVLVSQFEYRRPNADRETREEARSVASESRVEGSASRVISSSRSSAGCASMEATGEKSVSDACASPTCPCSKAIRATRAMSPVNVAARRTIAKGTSTAAAIASMIRPATAPCRGSPNSSRRAKSRSSGIMAARRARTERRLRSWEPGSEKAAIAVRSA
jgi:hypothetical protein